MAGSIIDFEQVWESNREYVRRLLIDLTHDADLSEDLLQETYLRATAGLAGYRGGGMRAWLGRIARNTFFSHVRKHSYSRECSLEEEVSANNMEPGSATHLDLVQVRKAISALPPALRDVLIMKHYGGFTYDEIGARLSCPAGTVKWRVSMAVDHLRIMLGRPPAQPDECAHLGGTALLDYLYGVVCAETADIRKHLSTCRACMENAEHIRGLMTRLDALENSHKIMELLDLDYQGVPTLYYDTNISNESSRPMDHAVFRMNNESKLLHVAAQGEKVGYEHEGDDCFEWQSDRVVRGRYVIPIAEPVAPGEILQVLTVSQMRPERHAKQIGDGKFRFRWTQFPTIRWAGENADTAVGYSQAIRLPKGSRVLKAYPMPAEIRTEENTTLIWHSVIAQFGPFDCVVEYRVRPDWPDGLG